jgi:hypothetical protein
MCVAKPSIEGQDLTGIKEAEVNVDSGSARSRRSIRSGIDKTGI